MADTSRAGGFVLVKHPILSSIIRAAKFDNDDLRRIRLTQDESISLHAEMLDLKYNVPRALVEWIEGGQQGFDFDGVYVLVTWPEDVPA